MVEIVGKAVGFFMHLDQYLNMIVQTYHSWTYVILFLIIFCETGLVITPILPGDSLIFVAGSFGGNGRLALFGTFGLLMVAAILGNCVNYALGNLLGMSVISKGKIPFIRVEHVEKTHRYFEKYGALTLVITRFLPIVRTISPFMAGVGKMDYRRFMIFNVLGAVLWVSLFYWGGAFFGNLTFVQENFSMVIFAIIFLTVVPYIYQFLFSRRKM